MKDGFVKVAAATPEIRVADCDYNAERIIEIIKEAEGKGVDLLVFPELCGLHRGRSFLFGHAA